METFPSAYAARKHARRPEQLDKQDNRDMGSERTPRNRPQEGPEGLRARREAESRIEADLPPLPKPLVQELTRTSARPLDARWFTAKALTALEEGDVAGALEHASAAKKAANRSPSVREIRGVATYLSGNFQEALADLQAFRRLTESSVQDARIADCYRGLKRPMRAVEFLEQKGTSGVGAALVRAGALADAGDVSGARAALRMAGLPDATIPAAGFLPVGRLGTAIRSG